VVITMGCGETCPVLPGKRYVDWPVDDPAGQDLETVRLILDDIDVRVRRLLASLWEAPARRKPEGQAGVDRWSAGSGSRPYTHGAKTTSRPSGSR
jgi:hypothetical protein